MSTPSQNRQARAQKEYVLKLYVTGATRRSQRAISNLNAICEEHLQGRYDLEVVRPRVILPRRNGPRKR